MSNKSIDNNSYVILIGDTFFAEDNVDIQNYTKISNFRVTRCWDFARRFNSLSQAKKALEVLHTGTIAKVSFVTIDMGE